MSLENAQYIHQLVETNPTTQDYVSAGDDHLRMVKRTLKATFPGIKGPVTVSQDILNSVPPKLTEKIEALALDSMPKGSMIVFDLPNNNNQIPAGWALCNGQTVQGYGVTPDLRDLFIKGWNGVDPAGGAGGTNDITTSGSGVHNHVATSGPATLTENQLPKIRLFTKGSFQAGGYDGGVNQFFRIQIGDPYGQSDVIAEFGGGQAHSHGDGTTSDAGSHQHTATINPRHYRAVWIVKTAALVLPT